VEKARGSRGAGAVDRCGRRFSCVVELTPRLQVRVNETEGLLEALRLGMGLCQVPDLLVQDELARGELRELLPSCRPEPMPISVVYPSARLLPARVRVAIDELEVLRQRTGSSADAATGAAMPGAPAKRTCRTPVQRQRPLGRQWPRHRTASCRSIHAVATDTGTWLRRPRRRADHDSGDPPDRRIHRGLPTRCRHWRTNSLRLA
jgi:hypothetical protein